VSENPRFADVSIAGKIDRPLTYRIPDTLREAVTVGSVVRVPLKTRQVTGFVVSLSGATDREGVRDILDLVDCAPVLSDELLELGRWVSAYYMAPTGDVLKRALPPGMARATRWRVRVLHVPSEEESKTWSTTHPAWIEVMKIVTTRPWTDLRDLARRGRNLPAVARRLATKGYLELRQDLGGRDLGQKHRRWVYARLPEAQLYEEAERIRRRAPKLARCLEILAARGGALPARDLQREADAGSDTVRRLVRRGWARIAAEAEERRAPILWGSEGDPRHTLTGAQRAADEILAARLKEGKFHAVLLHGITGSGKTEVFLRAIARALEGGRKALVLVPEISLAAQTVGRVRSRFGGRVEIYHSRLSAGERRDGWYRIRRGEVDVVVGARSAVFVPLAPLGLVVVDEEHEPAYKESESPRYHGRDVALVRARINDALVILSTATPSLETYDNAIRGKYERVALDDRVGGRPLPPVTLVDLRHEPRGRQRVLSLTLKRKIEEALGRSEQVMLFLNRRSFAPHVQCEACGRSFRCGTCDVALAYHAREREMKCHLCGFHIPAVERCPECGATRLRYSGVGTQRVEREIRSSFPGARIERMDLDTTQRRGAHDRILERFRRREVDVLLGTQMIAKGLDFPQVSLVGVINADTALNLPDFRASERTFDLLTQVAGRAGRGEVGGEVVIQTYLPQHASLECARTHDFRSFYRRAVGDRRAAGYPPETRLIRLICEGRDLNLVTRQIRFAARSLRAELDRRKSRATEVLGPVPAGLARVKDKHRWHFLVKTKEPSLARDAIRASLGKGTKRQCRFIVDVDPIDMM